MLMNIQRKGRYTGLSLVSTLAACLYGIFIWRLSFRAQGQVYFTLVDDAMVSMRYAQHLARGFGLVWNIGQKPVEGFTNPGWMLLMAALHLFPIPASKISLGVMLVSALILLINILIVYKICRALQPDSKVAPLMAATITAFLFSVDLLVAEGYGSGFVDAAHRCGVACRPSDE